MYEIQAAEGGPPVRSPVGSDRFRRRRGRIGPFVIRHGVPEDYVKAYAWFSITAARKLRDAKKNKDIVKKKSVYEGDL